MAISDVNTAVAMTLTALIYPVGATDTLVPTRSQTPTASPTQIKFTPTYQNVPTSSGISVCDNSAWISDVSIPDGTILAPGQTFVKTWMFKNTGSCTWSADYSLTYISGNAMGGATTSIGQSVAPGAQAEVSISFKAPNTVGTYTGYWRLANGQGVAFGVIVYVQIVVSNDASTLTPTPTPTPTSEATGTPTPTPEDTFTPTTTPTPTTEPTSTQTATPTSTSEPSYTPTPTETPTP